MKGARLAVRVLFALCLLPSAFSSALADKVITKDGKVYTGKILIDGDKAVLIGNPPFDPNSTLIKTEDIQTIVYEEYKQKSPAERRRGVAVNLHLMGNAYSSSELSLDPAPGLLVEGGFRFHPVIELGAGVQWSPGVSVSGDPLSVQADSLSRAYEDFWMYSLNITGKIYPFYRKSTWKTEPYVLAGYGMSRLIPASSGDSLKGVGWLMGAGAIHPLRKHLFLDGRFAYQRITYDEVSFLGQEGAIDPDIIEHQYTLSVGLSYRF